MSLKWLLWLLVFRFQTRYVKDSLKYRGSMLWNTVCYHKQELGRSSLNNLKNAYSPETTLRNSNLTYFPHLLLALYIPIFFYLEVIIYIIFYFQIQVIFTQRVIFLFSSHDPSSMQLKILSRINKGHHKCYRSTRTKLYHFDSTLHRKPTKKVITFQ